MPLYQCDKAVLSLTNGAEPFLQAYSTNTLDQPKNAFVDLRGRIVVICDQTRASKDEVRLVVEKSVVGRLLDHLKIYLDLTGATIRPLSGFVYFDLESDQRPAAGDVCIEQPKGRLLITSVPRKATVTEEEFTRFRLAHRLPLQGKDFEDEMLLNVFDEGVVSYTKGCYLGQEIIARVHHRAHPPKRLVVKHGSECRPGENMTSRVFDASRGEEMGFVWEEVGNDVTAK